MSRRTLRHIAPAAGALAAAAALSAAFPAAADSETDALKAEIAQMRADYEARIAALEARVAAAEADRSAETSASSEDAPTPPDAVGPPADETVPVETVQAEAAPADLPTGVVPGGNALNPGLSVVLTGNYFVDSRDPGAQRISGFPIADEAGLPDRGFSLGESEVTLAANVDPYFFGSLTVAFDGQGEAAVEEAYIRTTALPAGLTAKAGRFFSGVGYLNERHAHSWLFSDMPLPYRALLGGQYGDDGVQLRWIAPTELFVEFGAEAYRGDSFPAGGAANHGAGVWTAYVHAGSDINDSWSWLGGASFLHARADGRETEDPVNGLDVFSGENDVAILTAVAKWAPGGNPIQRNATLTAEYFWGNQNGLFNGVPVDVDRTGWYIQGVYQFMPRWIVGLRYAQVDGDDPGPLLTGSTLDPLGNSPWAASALIEYDTSEFTRLRVQYTRDESDRIASDQILFQFTATYGPHDAHRY
ncbi:MAG: hypothetical protein K1X35_13230 [Caulobacteraceae bacterium]|nr:hypothetical protein [Caulobacteraceae bacterium]